MTDSELKLPLIFGTKKAFQKSCVVYEAGGKEVAVCRGDSILGNLDKAELIVTAVNSHQLLIDALEKIGNHQKPIMNSTYSKETYQYLLGLWKQAVIAKAALKAARGK